MPFKRQDKTRLVILRDGNESWLTFCLSHMSLSVNVLRFGVWQLQAKKS